MGITWGVYQLDNICFVTVWLPRISVSPQSEPVYHLGTVPSFWIQMSGRCIAKLFRVWAGESRETLSECRPVLTSILTDQVLWLPRSHTSRVHWFHLAEIDFGCDSQHRQWCGLITYECALSALSGFLNTPTFSVPIQNSAETSIFENQGLHFPPSRILNSDSECHWTAGLDHYSYQSLSYLPARRYYYR